MSQESIVIDPMIRELMETAAIGEAAKLFLQSDLGRHVTGCAAEEVEEALASLIDADPTDTKNIAALQTKIHVARAAVSWLANAMTAGEHAMRQLEDES